MANLIQILIDNGVVKYGKFKLSSGASSSIYCDFRLLTGLPKLKKVICHELGKLITNTNNIVVAGVPMGAIPYATTISDIFNIPMIMIRNERKKYGMRNIIEGDVQNRTVLLIEDVITSGASVLKIIKILEAEQIKIKQIVAILDFEAGGMDMLRKKGYNVTALFKLSEINRNHNNNKYINPFITKIKTIIKQKKTNIILSIDENDSDKMINLIDKVGKHILGVKVHIDLFYPADRSHLISHIERLKRKHNLIIIEDRKYADIGSIVIKQVNRIKQWADIVTAHCVTGPDMIKALNDTGVGILLIHTLSTKNNLIDNKYSEHVKIMGLKNSNVIGFITQNKVLDGYLNFSPGVNISTKKDEYGQIYNTPDDLKKRGTNVFIIGRGIYENNNPVKVAKIYQKLCLI